MLGHHQPKGLQVCNGSAESLHPLRLLHGSGTGLAKHYPHSNRAEPPLLGIYFYKTPLSVNLAVWRSNL